jgi:hypothetical protein
MCNEILKFVDREYKVSKSKDEMMLSSFKTAFKGVPASYSNLKKIVDKCMEDADDKVKFALEVEEVIAQTEDELRSLFTSIKESVSIIKNSSSFIRTKEVEE